MAMSKDERNVFEKFVSELETNIVGKRVINVTYNEEAREVVLELETGTVLTVAAYGSCCAYGDLTFAERLNFSDNAITSIKIEEEDNWNNSFSIFLMSSFSGSGEVAQLNGAVSEGTGCYSYGWTLTVTVN